jgi:hypothetical protein
MTQIDYPQVRKIRDQARRKKRKMSPYWEEGVRKSALYLLKLDPETNKLVFVTTLSFVSLFYFRLASMISFV